MFINWPLIMVLISLGIPGCIIAPKKLVDFLLNDQPIQLRQKLRFLATLQTLIMLVVMCFIGSILSKYTGLHAFILDGMLDKRMGIEALITLLFPALFFSAIAFIVFSVIFYGLGKKIIGTSNLDTMNQLQHHLGFLGCTLYGGITEELISRWGILNLSTFFILLFSKSYTPAVMWSSIIIASIIFSVGQLPIYIAAGCQSNRKFMYFYICLSSILSIIFSCVFWQYGILCSMLCHTFFHFYWSLLKRGTHRIKLK